MDRHDDPEQAGLRSLVESLLEDDSFLHAGATLAANQVLLTAEADQTLAALLAQAEQNRDDDRAVAISQLRAFVGRCRRTGLAAVFLPDHPDIDPAVVSAVGTDMRAADEAEESYDRTGNINALIAAATAWHQVMAYPGLASAYPGLRAALLNNGGGVLLRRYWAVGLQEDLTGALEALRIAVALTPPHSHLVVGRLCNLGLAIREVYRQSSDGPALERAIGAFEMAAQVAAAQPQPAPTALINLALGLQDRYLRRGDLGDLARAIDCCEQACRNAESVGAQVMLGDLLRRRHESIGERPDLTRALTLLRGALQATPADPRSAPGAWWIWALPCLTSTPNPVIQATFSQRCSCSLRPCR